MFIKKVLANIIEKLMSLINLVVSFRDKDTKKVKHRNIANLSELPPKSKNIKMRLCGLIMLRI
ncbi:hypothetical protein VAMP_262149n70 [Candidatus Vampirococcus lugosii]|uniref:Uncharacterized protein n=1 Tax=Candidatus Vampirococcus lugosii TaxID=2789015 RepID=A0ABS5QMT7_9BACT|nr:hypothetical protein [Candidatus Vampirococcus lugosii]